MKSLNKVLLIGHLGKDPDFKTTQNGTPCATFSLATSKSWKNEAGEKKESTSWHSIVVWRKLAEICTEYLKKGSRIYMEGEINTRSYDKDGEKKYITEITMNDLVMLDSKPSSSQEKSTVPDVSSANEQPQEQDLPF